MFRLLTPIVLIGVAIATFVLFTDPYYQTIKTLRAQEREYNDALDKSRDLKEQRNKLISKENLISPDDMQKLERLLPNNVDNIRLIIDIDNIAARYGQRIRNVTVGAPSESREAGNTLAVGAPADRVGSVELSFTTTARYEDFLRFIQDLEKSVRIVDVQNISFTSGDAELTTYTVLVKTYWLR